MAGARPHLLIIGTCDRTALSAAWAPKEIAAKMGDSTTLGKKTAAAIPGAELVEIPNVGHVPQVEAWETYLAALTRFLAR